MLHLANDYSAAGRHAEAIKLAEQTLALRKQKDGPANPEYDWRHAEPVDHLSLFWSTSSRPCGSVRRRCRWPSQPSDPTTRSRSISCTTWP